MNRVIVYTDGGCIGNPGPGGWAFATIVEGAVTSRNGAEKQTTNNRMELTAVIEALRHVTAQNLAPPNEEITMITDSEYVRRGVTEWIRNWIKNGWRTSSKTPVKNKDLWVTLHELESSRSVEWKWVRGHSGNEYNELCDRLVHEAIDSLES